jgi:ribosomal protein S18 acetylase RimI-like enzyme
MIALSVRRATAEDAGVLGVIGPAAYAEAYGYLWDRPDAYAEQLQTFGSDAFKRLLRRPDARVWVSETGGTVVGFLSMIIGSIDPAEHRPGGAELPRIYILGPAQRIGLGRLLLDAAIRQAAIEGLSHVWLDAMSSADQARRAYLRWGFCEIGSSVFESRFGPACLPWLL